MKTLTELAAYIENLPPQQKAGTLRIWGQWFGRPMDNVHQCIGCQAIEDKLVLKFNEGERLTIWSPVNAFVASDTTLTFGSASRVRWEWHYYGRPKVPENLVFLEYEVQDGKIMCRSNSNRSVGESASLSAPAVQICAM